MSTVSATPRPAPMSPEPARDRDRAALAALHVASWRAHYGGILDAQTLGAPLEREKRESWAHRRLDGRCLLLRDAEGIAAFAAFDPDHADGLFLDNLHVRPGLHGLGHGRALMRAVAQLAGRGPLWLEVLAANRQAREIYRAWGGQEGPVFDDTILGRSVPAHRVTWPDAERLVMRLTQRVSP